MYKTVQVSIMQIGWEVVEYISINEWRVIHQGERGITLCGRVFYDEEETKKEAERLNELYAQREALEELGI